MQTHWQIAKKQGFAEADPTNDVCGFDAARKLAILSSIGFRANVTFDDGFGGRH